MDLTEARHVLTHTARINEGGYVADCRDLVLAKLDAAIATIERQAAELAALRAVAGAAHALHIADRKSAGPIRAEWTALNTALAALAEVDAHERRGGGPMTDSVDLDAVPADDDGVHVEHLGNLLEVLIILRPGGQDRLTLSMPDALDLRDAITAWAASRGGEA